MPTDAAITAETMSGPMQVDWTYRVGDTWASETLAVLVNGFGVDLTANGWTVLAQARIGGAVVASWSLEDGTISLDTAEVDGVTTSTVQLVHTPKQSRSRGPFAGAAFELEVSRYAEGETDPLESYTIAEHRITALPDGAHR